MSISSDINHTLGIPLAAGNGISLGISISLPQVKCCVLMMCTTALSESYLLFDSDEYTYFHICTSFDGIDHATCSRLIGKSSLDNP